MNKQIRLVVFTLDEQRYALLLSVVERVVRAVKITTLPKAPEIVLGMIRVRERIIPVVNIRRRFRLPEREINLSDQLIIAHTSKRTTAIVADKVIGVIECPDYDMIAAENITAGVEYVRGVLKIGDGMILIHDIDKFLSLDEEKELDEAMKHS